MQLLDIFFLLIGITRNSLINVFPQIMSRIVLVHMIFPLVEEGHWSIFLAVMCWSFAEIVRFSFYALKEMDICVYTTYLGRPVATVRYNLFIVNYPLGVSSELFSFY